MRLNGSTKLACSLILVAAGLVSGASGELPERYQEWLDNEVGLIITPAEREVFVGLSGDSTRDLFIKEFWECRDPTPGTFINEYRDEFELRFSMAQRLYRRGSRPAWRTDRGRIYILLGSPDHIERLPSSRNFYPLEIWYYTRASGMTHPINLLFFKRYGLGNYFLYSPSLDWVMGLLTPTHAHLMAVMPNDIATRAMLEENLQLSPTEVPVVDAALFVGPQVRGAEAEAVLARVQAPPQVRPVYINRYLAGVVEADYFFKTVPFLASSHIFANPEGGALIEIAIEIPADALPFEKTEKDYYLQPEVIGELKDNVGARIDGFESRVQVRFTPEEVETHRFLPLVYRQRLLGFPGDYTLDLTLRTPTTRAVGHQSLKVLIPATSTERMSLSSLLLSYGAEEPESALIETPFLRDEKLILPRVDRRFRRGSSAHVYYEITLPERRQSGSPLEAEYLVLRANDIVKRETLPLPGGRGEDVLHIHHPLPLSELETGAYTLVVQVTDEVLGQTVVGETDFQITDEFQVRGRIDAVVTDNLVPTETETRLGRYWLGRGDLARAREHFETAYRNRPQSTEARVNLARVLVLQGETKIARDLLNAALSNDGENVDALLALAYVHYRLGEPDRAITNYERALSVRQTELAWNGLAELYLSLGQVEKALDCLKRSLEVNANQPHVLSKIKEIQGNERGIHEGK